VESIASELGIGMMTNIKNPPIVLLESCFLSNEDEEVIGA